MTLSWLPPKDDGGSKITNYVIEKREANRKSWVHVTNEPKECIFTVPKLLEGHEYIFRIMAQNKYGVGEPLDSEPETARNLFSTCIMIVSNVRCSWGMSAGTASVRAGVSICSGGGGAETCQGLGLLAGPTAGVQCHLYIQLCTLSGGIEKGLWAEQMAMMRVNRRADEQGREGCTGS